MKKIVALLLLAFFCIAANAYAKVSEDIVKQAHKNSVVVYSVYRLTVKDFANPRQIYMSRGSGTVYRVESKGTYILSVNHLMYHPRQYTFDHLAVYFEDGTWHNGFVAYSYAKVDKMIIYIPAFQWSSHAEFEATPPLEHHIFAFSTDDLTCLNVRDGKVRWKCEEGYIVSEPQHFITIGAFHTPDFYMAQRGSFSAWGGMSGGGVFDAENGKLIGTVNAGRKGIGIFTPTLKAYDWEGSLIKELYPWMP